MIRTLIVEDHNLVRKAITQLFKDDKSVKIVGQAADGNEAIEFVRNNKLDIVLLDFNLPGINGLEVAEKLKRIQSNTKIMILTAGMHNAFIYRLLNAGVRGYLTKDMSKDEMVEAIKTVYKGKTYISPQIASQIILNKIHQKDSPISSLTNRELQIILLIAQNMNIETIADILHISPKTVCSYRYKIYEKLGVHNDVELILFALKNKLVEIES
ncbi:MAG: response regulator [Gammaproteobacteria bacterium]|nr:response regulator [Gammaproteobacteria bacterium]MCH9744892.1 response regulator [Gammaproteobacteria bacterium]